MVTRRSKPETDNAPGAFPQFAPVAVRARHDGWTAQRQRRFIEALASNGCVAEASRAIEGVEQPVYHFGAVVGTRRVYNDRLIMFLLRNRRAQRFAADSVRNADELIRARIEKLKAEWRKQWEAERQAESRDNGEAVVLSINKKLELMRQRTMAAMSPRTRELLAAYEAAKAEDEASGYNPYFEDEDGDGDGKG